MPEVFYLIPQSSPPYSVTNKHRPLALDSVITQINMICKDVPAFSAFVCKVNCTQAIHDIIAGQAGVRQLPAGVTWDTVINTLNNPSRNFISNVCADLGIVYDPDETIGELLNRICFSSEAGLGTTPTTTPYNNLTQQQKASFDAFCNKWGKQPPGQNETIKNMVGRLGTTMWNGAVTVPEVV
jgi:hypothetical protein